MKEGLTRGLGPEQSSVSNGAVTKTGQDPVSKPDACTDFLSTSVGYAIGGAAAFFSVAFFGTLNALPWSCMACDVVCVP